MVNPTGKGGLGDHPEHRSDGTWDRKKSYKYNLGVYAMMDRKTAVNVFKDMKDFPHLYTNAQVRAMRDVLEMNRPRDDYDQEIRATNHVVEKLHGKGPYIDDDGEAVPPQAPVVINFVPHDKKE